MFQRISFCTVRKCLMSQKKNDGQIESPLEALLVQYGDGFRKANMEEWELKANASEYSDQESAFRWKEPSSWSWDTQDSSDEEIFARMTHASGDESESSCGPYWSPKPVNSGGISFDTLKHMDDGWSASRERPPVPPGLHSTPQSSWQPYPDASTSRSSWPCR